MGLAPPSGAATADCKNRKGSKYPPDFKMSSAYRGVDTLLKLYYNRNRVEISIIL